MNVVITGLDLPGRSFCRPDGSLMENVHVGVQLRGEPSLLVPADEATARWELDITLVSHDDDGIDFRGPAVHGKRGDRFIYLTWGDVGPAGDFEMFRRAKLMLDRIPRNVLDPAAHEGRLAATVGLTDERGGPRCARVDPPAITWSVPAS